MRNYQSMNFWVVCKDAEQFKSFLEKYAETPHKYYFATPENIRTKNRNEILVHSWPIHWDESDQKFLRMVING